MGKVINKHYDLTVSRQWKKYGRQRNNSWFILSGLKINCLAHFYVQFRVQSNLHSRLALERHNNTVKEYENIEFIYNE